MNGVCTVFAVDATYDREQLLNHFKEHAMQTKVVNVQIPETDQERIEWLQADTSRLQDVYWYIQNEDGTVRQAIDKLAELQSTRSNGNTATPEASR